MARRNNPYVTFLMLVTVLAFGYGAYHFLLEKGGQSADAVEAPPTEEIARLREVIEEDLQHEECFQGLGSFNWHPNTKRYRIDVELQDGCGKADAIRLARRVNEVVNRATHGLEAEVGILVLGNEIYRLVP